MNYEGKVVAITGGARGIGLAIARAFRDNGAKVAVADIEALSNDDKEVADFSAQVDVTDETKIAAFVTQTEDELGAIDIFVSNAGILRTDEPSWDAAGASDEAWWTSFDVNVMGAVRCARNVWPGMRARGGGVFVIVASAAGLLAQIGAASYTASKHAAVSFAESLAIAHGEEGLQVVCVCPQAVRTAMLGDSDDGGIAGVDGVIEPEAVAQETLAAISEGRFLALPHARARDYEIFRATERDKWLRNMGQFRKQIIAARGRLF